MRGDAQLVLLAQSLSRVASVQHLARALCVAAAAFGCGDPPSPGVTEPDTEPTPFRLVPDTAVAWVGDTVEIHAASLQQADLGDLPPLVWLVTDTSIARIVQIEGLSVEVRVLSAGTTSVRAERDDIRAEMFFRARAEGELLASYAWAEIAWLQSPAVSEDGLIYLRRWDGTLIRLNPDLSLDWEVQSEAVAGALNPAIGPDGTVYVQGCRGTSAVSEAGVLLWHDSTRGDWETAPALDSFGSLWAAGRICPEEPISAWGITRFDPPGVAAVSIPGFNHEIRLAVIVRDSIIVATDHVGEVFAFTRDGTLMWFDTLPSRPTWFGPSVGLDGQTVYFPTRSHVVAIDALTGTRRWVWPASRYPLSPIVDADGTIYVQTDRRLVALNPDGTVRWVGAGIDSLEGVQWLSAGGAPALAEGGVLYVACREKLCAVNTADGSVRWRRSLPFPGMPGTILILPDSSILFTTIFRGIPTDSARVLKLRGRFPLADAPWPVDGGNLQRTRNSRLPD